MNFIYDCNCADCKAQKGVLNLSISKGFKNLLNVAEKAFKRLHKNGKYHPKDLKNTLEYQNLINETNAVFDKTIVDNVVDGALLKNLQNNVFYFSALKTHAQLFEASRLLLNSENKIKPFSEFYKEVAKTNETYNRQYLEAEYQFAVASSQMANKWAGFSEDYNLQYRTAGDKRVRDSHDVLRDTTLPKSDPFWDSFTPPNGWRCRCTVVEVLPEDYKVSDSKKAIEKGETATSQIGKDGKNKLAIFRFNPGKDKVIFPPNHPYNKVVGANVVKEVVNKKTEYKNYSIDQLKEVYKTQKIDKDKESTIMNTTTGYVGTLNSFDINEKLRKKLELSDNDKRTVNDLDSLIKKNKLNDNLMLYRNDGHGFIESHFGISVKGLDNKDAISKLKETGVTKISDKGFFSTSALKSENAFKFRKIHSEIRAKKETNAFVVNNYSESEIILSRNQKFNIIDIVEENDKIKIIIETD